MKLLFFFSSQAKILLSLTTQEYEQVLANCLENLMLMGGEGGSNERCGSIPSRGE